MRTSTFVVLVAYATYGCGSGSGSAVPGSQTGPADPASSPDGGPVTAAEIGTAGGTLQSPEGVRIDVPPGALDHPVTLTIARTDPTGLPANMTPLGAKFRLGPVGTTFNKFVQVTFPWEASRIPPGQSGGVLILRGSDKGANWVSMGAQLEGTNVTTWTEGFSDWQTVWYWYDCAFTVSTMSRDVGNPCYLIGASGAEVECLSDVFPGDGLAAAAAKSCRCLANIPDLPPKFNTYFCYYPHLVWIYESYCHFSCDANGGTCGGIGSSSGTTTFVATLAQKNEPVSFQKVPTPNAFGTATVQIVGSTLKYSLRANDLSARPVMAHLHLTPAGVCSQGQVIVTFPLSNGGGAVSTNSFVVDGVLPNPPEVNARNLDGSLMTFDQLVQHIRSGETYVNIHTVNNPFGEIRGDLR